MTTTKTIKTIGGGTLTVTPKTEPYNEVQNSSAFAVIKSDGSVFAWGNKDSGGDISSVASQLDGTIPVTQIFSNSSAFAALRSDGSVVTWGNKDSGGDSSTVSSQLNGDIDVKQIYSNQWGAFVALREDGSVVTWGNQNLGADSSAVLQLLNGDIDITQIYSSGRTFSALRSDNSIITWRYDWNKKVNFDIIKSNSEFSVTSIDHFDGVFAAVRADNTIASWGANSSVSGGSITDRIGYDKIKDELTNEVPIKEITIGYYAAAALKADGSVVAWGSISNGYDYSAMREKEVDIVDNKAIHAELNPKNPVIKIYTSGSPVDGQEAFAALRADGSVFTWGNKDYGGDISAVASQLNGDIDVKEIYHSGGTFAALREDGSVISWGAGGFEPTTSGMPKQIQINGTEIFNKLNGNIDVVKIFADDWSGLKAIRSDGSVVTWGMYGINEYDLDEKFDIKDVYSAGHNFAALREDGSIVTWGVGIDSKAVADLTDVVSFANPATDDIYIAPSKEIHINHAPTGSISIVGKATQEQKLTIKNTLADEDGLGDFSYQWLSNGKEIFGATNASYVLSVADVGKKISVQVSYLDGEGTEELVTSKTTATIASNISKKATSGNDEITGTAKAERINGLAGNDLIKGLGGNDTLIGGIGNDTLIGGAGADILTGGKGADIFKFTALSDSGITSKTRDTITDFLSGTDKIDLSAIDANEKLAGDQAFTFIGSAAFSKTNASGQLRFDSTSKILYGSTDADTSPEFSIQLNGVTNLSASDFIL